MTPLDPPEIPEGAKAVVVAFPHDETFVYDLFIADGRHWTGQLDQVDAAARLVAEGYRPQRAAGMLSTARGKAHRAARRSAA